MRHSTRCSSHRAQVRVSDRSPLPRRRGELPVREGLNLKQGRDNVSLLRRRFVCWVRYCCLSHGGVFFGSSRGTLVKSSKMPRALPPHHRRGHRIHSRQCVRLIRQISCGSPLYLLTTRIWGTLFQAKRDTALFPQVGNSKGCRPVQNDADVAKFYIAQCPVVPRPCPDVRGQDEP